MTDSLPSSWVARTFTRIVDHPWLCSSALIFISAVALGGYFRPTWPREVWASVTGGKVNLEVEEQRPSGGRGRLAGNVRRDSLGSAECFVVVQSEQLFTLEGAAALRDVVSEFRALETVDSVRWLDQAPPLNIFGLTEPVLPRGQASPQRFAMAKEKALKHPLVVGLYLSPDAKTTLLGINFNWVYVDEDSDCNQQLVSIAKQTMKRHPNVKMEFSVTGQVPLRLAVLENQASNELTFQLIGYSMILIMAVILFRGLSVVLVVACAPALGVFWTLGFLRYFGWEDNPFSQVILPVLLSLVGFADGVHMMVFIRRCLSAGQSAKEACRHALATVGVACSLTTITTAIGMGSLAFSQHKVVREFAFSCVMGTSTILVSVLLVIPLACWSPWGRRLARGAERGVVDRSLKKIGIPVAAVMNHHRFVAYLAIAILVVLGATTLQLRPDDRQSNALPSGSEAQKTLAILDDTMGGLEVATIGIAWDDATIEPRDVGQVIYEIDQMIDAEPLLSHPISLCRVLAALPGEDQVVDRMGMAELLPPPLKLALYDYENQKATTTFRVRDLGTAAYKPSFERLEQGLAGLEKSHPGFTFRLDGMPIWRWRNLYKIVSDLAMSLGTASIEILIVMGIAFRSLRLGLIAIMPNMIPLAASGTFMALFGWPLDVVSVCSFTVCLGIAVDDTIHFLSRYQEEQLHQPVKLLALRQAFEGVGTGMIMTTIVLVAGFSSVLISQTQDHRVFGMLGIITLLSALVCDLFLLPSLLLQFDRTKKQSQEPG